MISFIKEGFGRGDKNAKKSEISVGGAWFWGLGDFRGYCGEGV